MIYVHSSAFHELFRQNILNACCYPDGYVMRVRYGREYLSPDLIKDGAWKKLTGEECVFVFAEGAMENKAAGGTAKRDYRFIPIRYCKVQDVQMAAGIFIMDVKVGDFLDYGETLDRTREDLWDKEIKGHPDRPYPKGFQGSEGSYVYRAVALTASPLETESEMDWRSLVDRLNRSELRDCVTFQVRGFYRFNPWPLSLVYPERCVKSVAKGPDAVYRFRTGETILVKVLLYGQANAEATGKSINVDFDAKAFTSTSVGKIPINSRYNEQRVLLPCVRGTDTVVSAFTLQPIGDDSKIWAPQPSFVVEISPSAGYLLGVAGLFALAFFAANSGAFTDYLFLWDGRLRTDLLGSINKLTKPIGALLFLVGTWIYLRKFPLK